MRTLRIFRYGFLVGGQEIADMWSPVTWLVAWLPRIVFQASFFALLGMLLDSPDRERYLLVGGVMAVAANAVTLTISVSTWDRWDGTYPLIVVAPSSLVPVILGRTSVWLLNGIASALATLAVLSVVFDAGFGWTALAIAAPLIALTCLGLYCLAVCLGSFITRFPRSRNIVIILAWTSVSALCGVMVPISFWPAPVEALVNLLPVTHGLQAVRLALDGGAIGEILKQAGFEALTAAGWLLVAILTIDRMADAGRRSGSIEFV